MIEAHTKTGAVVTPALIRSSEPAPKTVQTNHSRVRLQVPEPENVHPNSAPGGVDMAIGTELYCTKDKITFS